MESNESLMESGFLSCRSTWNTDPDIVDARKMMEKEFDSDDDTVESDRWEDANDTFETSRVELKS